VIRNGVRFRNAKTEDREAETAVFCREAGEALERSGAASWWAATEVAKGSGSSFTDFVATLKTGKDLLLQHMDWLGRSKGKRVTLITSALTGGEEEGAVATVRYSSFVGIGHEADAVDWLGSSVVIHHRSGGNQLGGHYEAVLWADSSAAGGGLDPAVTGVFQARHPYLQALRTSSGGKAAYEEEVVEVEVVEEETGEEEQAPPLEEDDFDDAFDGAFDGAFDVDKAFDDAFN
jgi:hypothetical protein